MSSPRVLIDTNVLLSGMFWKGNEARLLEMSTSGDILILIPEFVLDEARRVIASKFQDRMDALDAALILLTYEILPRPASESLESARQAVRDLNDAEILASIIEAQPDYAVSGDKDLLTPEVQSVFPITRCRDFLQEMEGED